MDDVMKIELQHPFIHRYPELAGEEKLVRLYLKCALEHENTRGQIKISRYWNNSFYYAVYGDDLENCKMALTYTDKPVHAYEQLIEVYPELSNIEWHVMLAVVIGDHNPRVRDAWFEMQRAAYRNMMKTLKNETIIPDFVLNDIDRLNQYGKYDMGCVREVIAAASRRRLKETAEWIRNNEEAYKKKVLLERIEQQKKKKS